jgi:excisionase family DNA binding protein
VAQDALLTVGQVAELLNVSKWFVYDHGHELGLVKVGGANRYRRSAVNEFLEAPAERAREVRRPGPVRRGRRVPLLDVAASDK